MTTSDASVRALEQALGTDAVRTDLNTLDLFSTDLHASGPRPIGVVRPRSADGVAQAVAAAISHGCTVVPRGGGLSYTGGYRCTAEPCVLFDLAGLDTIESISEEDMIVVAEIGVTWKQLYAELAPRRLRLPFFGTFSGAGATVGGGLSQGAVFFGSARYDSAAEIVLGLEVATAEHGLVRTGQWAPPNSTKPVFRNFGPDLTGLFLHDGGALGIKTRAVLKLIREPDETGYASFSLPSLEDAASALSAVARTDACEDLYVLDPQAVATAADQRGGFRGAIGAVRAVAGKADGPLGAARALADLARGGRGGGSSAGFTLHCVAAARTRRALAADLELIDRTVRGMGGRRIPAAVPRIVRADPFPDLNGVLGDGGGRWVALNAKVAHSEGRALVAAHQEAMSRHAAATAAHGVRVTYLLSAIGTQSFSFEAVFHWTDAWLPIHRASVDPIRLAGWEEPAPNPCARALIDQLRDDTLELFKTFGAASSQIGRTYAYADVIAPEAKAAIESIKRALDPSGRMNPGVLQL